MKAIALRAEGLVASLALGGIMVLPLAEIFSRRFLGGGIPGSGPIAQNLTLWVGLFGAAIAAREGKLLTLATGEFLPKGRIGDFAHIVAATIGAAVSTMFVLGGIALVQERSRGRRRHRRRHSHLGGRSRAADRLRADCAPPRLARVAARGSAARSRRSASSPASSCTSRAAAFEGQAMWPWLTMVVVAAVLGAPIFVLLGGIAVFASLAQGNTPVVLMIRAYEQLTTSTGLAAIPLFTFAGFMLAEGQIVRAAAARPARLVRLGARRDRRGGGDALRVFHAVHGRLGRDDPRARRAAAARRSSPTAIASGFRSAC